MVTSFRLQINSPIEFRYIQLKISLKEEIKMSEEDNRLAKLLDRIHQVESRIQQLEAKKNNPIERIKQDLIKQKIYSGRFIKVQSDYYDLTLEDRAKLLHGNTNQLCKSIIFENTSCSHDNCNDPTDSKYYCVIIQYVGKHILSIFSLHS